jgi:hypothetical protein
MHVIHWKSRLTYKGLHIVMSQKTELFITRAVRTSNSKKYRPFQLVCLQSRRGKYGNTTEHDSHVNCPTWHLHIANYSNLSETLGFWNVSMYNATFRKLDVFPSSGEWRETPILLGPLQTANLNHFLRDPTGQMSSSFTWKRKQVKFPKRCVL